LVRDSPQYVGYQCDLRLIQQVLQRICQWAQPRLVRVDKR
jgi:hypothetical protein